MTVDIRARLCCSLRSSLHRCRWAEAGRNRERTRYAYLPGSAECSGGDSPWGDCEARVRLVHEVVAALPTNVQSLDVRGTVVSAPAPTSMTNDRVKVMAPTVGAVPTLVIE